MFIKFILNKPYKHIIRGIVKLVNSYPLSLPKADKLILAFPDGGELENIDCEIPFLYATYPNLEILNE